MLQYAGVMSLGGFNERMMVNLFNKKRIVWGNE